MDTGHRWTQMDTDSCFRIKNSSVATCPRVPELAKAHAYPLATSSLLGLVAILPFGKSRAYARLFLVGH